MVKVGETVFDADLDADTATRALERIRPGSVVAVTGVYSYQWGPPPSFRLFLRSADDVTRAVGGAVVDAAAHGRDGGDARARAPASRSSGSRLTANRKRQQYQAVLNERTRVGRELHDTLEQGLAGIALQLEAVSGSLRRVAGDRRGESLDVARQMLRYSLEETRRSVMDLRSQALESRDLAGRADGHGAADDAAGRPRTPTCASKARRHRLDASHEHHLLRIGLEALTNALKHSGRARASTSCCASLPDATELIVQDDGCGLEQGLQDVRRSHFGLQGIRERVDKLGGALQIDSTPGAGTRLSVTRARARDPRTRRRAGGAG